MPGNEEYSEEIVEKAKSMGHIPIEEWKGDPDNWTPPDEFIKRGETFMPFLKAQNRKYEEEVENLKITVSTLTEREKKRQEEIDRLSKMSEKTAQMAYQKAKQDILDQQRQAAGIGDVEAFDELEAKKEKLTPPFQPVAIETKPAQPQVDSPPPEYVEWAKQNTWYETDEFLKAVADATAGRIKKQNPNITFPALLAETEAQVKKEMPHKFTNPNREAGSLVDEGQTRGNVGASSNKQNYANLPPDAKAQCNKLVEQGLCTQENWVKLYYEG